MSSRHLAASEAAALADGAEGAAPAKSAITLENAYYARSAASGTAQATVRAEWTYRMTTNAVGVSTSIKKWVEGR